jgi:hypothetical protein
MQHYESYKRALITVLIADRNARAMGDARLASVSS